MPEKVIEALVEGGKATPAPPLGPQLATFKLNIGNVIKDINEKTKEFEGMKVPVKIIVDMETKNYRIEVGTPPISSLIKKELGLEKLAPEGKEEGGEGEGEEKKESKEGGRVIVGDLTLDQILKITKMKKDSLLAKDFKKAVKEVVAACVSMPVTIEGKSPKEILKEIDEGKYDDKILG